MTVYPMDTDLGNHILCHTMIMLYEHELYLTAKINGGSTALALPG